MKKIPFICLLALFSFSNIFSQDYFSIINELGADYSIDENMDSTITYAYKPISMV